MSYSAVQTDHESWDGTCYMVRVLTTESWERTCYMVRILILEGYLSDDGKVAMRVILLGDIGIGWMWIVVGKELLDRGSVF